MFKICFVGAGSTIFARNLIGDCIVMPELGDFQVALYDIDPERLNDSYLILENINANYKGKAQISKTLNRKEALQGADFVVNAIQVGGYDPCTITDFEVPKKYGLRETIADTLGVGGIFRALRTIPVLESLTEDMKTACPNALFLNYVNPMAIITGYLQQYLWPNTIGLCHSVQGCVPTLLMDVGMSEYENKTKWKIAGINHQAWLTEVQDLEGHDLYPEIKKRSYDKAYAKSMEKDLVRMEIMHRFGYYVTESSEHNAEYTPWFIKKNHPELITRYAIPLDEYPRRCIKQIAEWKEMRASLLDKHITHERTHEFASGIIDAMVNGHPYLLHGNVQNHHLIDNLPEDSCVEVECVVDRNGVHPTPFGALPEQCAAINRTNINVQNMTLLAAKERRKDLVVMAAALDPHVGAELTLEEIQNLVEDLFVAHKDWLPEYK
jgi:alpha-galactosidase